MGNDLLDSMLGDMLEGGEEEGKGSSARQPSSDELGDLIGGLMGSQGDSGGGMGELLGNLLGGGSQGSGIGEMLGALLGGGQQSGSASDLGDVIGGMLGGGGGQQVQDLSQIPVLGPILESLSKKFGLPPQVAAMLLTGVLQMISGGEKGFDLSRLMEDPSAAEEIAGEVAGRVGVDDDTATQAVQHILQSLLGGLQ